MTELNQVSVSVLRVQDGDVLIVTLKDDFAESDSKALLEAFGKAFKDKGVGVIITPDVGLTLVHSGVTVDAKV